MLVNAEGSTAFQERFLDMERESVISRYKLAKNTAAPATSQDRTTRGDDLAYKSTPEPGLLARSRCNNARPNAVYGKRGDESTPWQNLRRDMKNAPTVPRLTLAHAPKQSRPSKREQTGYLRPLFPPN